MRLLCALLLLLGLSACSIEKDSESTGAGQSDRSAPDPTRTPTPDPADPDPADPDPAAPVQPDASRTPACAEVRAGIDAFNAGELVSTVEHFRAALPLARQQARTDPSKGADDLLEAITYYAELPPQDYPSAAASSLEFAKNKAITLGQCVVGGGPSEPSAPQRSPGITT